ncbi:49 [Xenorhabdus bovienii str. Intermedium]|uniref:49 n=2 Tax=Xenorhabdus bovienii TaxID=40576 RepID=A0A077QN21_XENBV|nr:49 [Xenorhabdus bovienii str. Intermedium]
MSLAAYAVVNPMAKSPAERKAAQRQRQKDSGVTKIELLLDNQEMAMLKQNCSLRRPGRDPYDVAEYLALLIRKDNAEVQQKMQVLSTRQCGKCGDALPVTECCLSGDSACWTTLGWHEVKL